MRIFYKLIYKMAGLEKALVNMILHFLELHPLIAKAWQNDSFPAMSIQKRTGGQVTGYFRKRQTRFRPNGISDILGFTKDGRFLALEVKSEKGRLTPDQRTFLLAAKSSNCIAGCVRSLDDVELLLKECL